jgi:hypothetical protein
MSDHNILVRFHLLWNQLHKVLAQGLDEPGTFILQSHRDMGGSGSHGGQEICRGGYQHTRLHAVAAGVPSATGSVSLGVVPSAAGSVRLGVGLCADLWAGGSVGQDGDRLLPLVALAGLDEEQLGLPSQGGAPQPMQKVCELLVVTLESES